MGELRSPAGQMKLAGLDEAELGMAVCHTGVAGINKATRSAPAGVIQFE